VILELVQKTGYNKESSIVGHFGTNVYVGHFGTNVYVGHFGTNVYVGHFGTNVYVGHFGTNVYVGHFGTNVYDMRQSLCREGDQLCRISYVNLSPEEGNNPFVKHCRFSALEQLQCAQYQSEECYLCVRCEMNGS